MCGDLALFGEVLVHIQQPVRQNLHRADLMIAAQENKNGLYSCHLLLLLEDLSDVALCKCFGFKGLAAGVKLQEAKECKFLNPDVLLALLKHHLNEE